MKSVSKSMALPSFLTESRKSSFILFAILACALVFGPFGPSGQPDPTIIQTAPKPDYHGYLSVPHFNMSAMQEQQCAGALMWGFVTLTYLLPAVLLTANLLGSSDNKTGEPDVEGFCRCAEDPELGSALPSSF